MTTDDQNYIGQIVAIGKQRQSKVPPELICAIIKQESNWNPAAQVLTGGDGIRGGSYGLAQVSLQTALNLDKHATAARLLDVRYNIEMCYRVCEQNWEAASGRLEDVISRYNSGKDFWRAPEATKLLYFPNVQRYMTMYKKQLISSEQLSSEASSPKA